MRTRTWAVLVGAVLVAAPAGAQQIIDPDPGGLIQNETSLTLLPGTPGMPLWLAVAYNNDPTGNTGLGVGLSNDGGLSWANFALPMPLDPGGSGQFMTDAFDPAAAFDTMGNLFVAQISTLGGWPGPSGLFVTRWDSNVPAWFPPSTVSYNPGAVGSPDPFYRFNDKCHLTVDLDPAGLSPFGNNVYVTWIQDGGFNMGPWSDIFFAASPTQGATWNYPGGSPVPAPINDVPYNPVGLPPFDMANGPNVAVAPDGTIYVAWMDIDVTQTQAVGTLFIDRSTDGGVTWGADQPVQAGVLGCPGNLSTSSRADARARSYPCLGISPFQNPLLQYDVYLVYPADPDGMGGQDEGDVFITVSPDGGVTWSPPNRINQDGTFNDQFQPWIAVKPNGWIDVAWYDRRNDPTDTLWDVVITRSIDGGFTFAPELFLTDPTTVFATPNMAWGERWMGEYLGLDVDEEFAYIAFTSSISDTLGDVYFTSVHNFQINTDAPETGLGETPRLGLACPNPFRPDALVAYSLPEAGAARLVVHDLAGRTVRVLADAPATAGDHRVAWDGRDTEGHLVASGVYFVRLSVGEERLSEKMTLLR